MKRLNSKTTLWVFIFLTVFLFAQAAWWYVFMERLIEEKVSLATELGASNEVIENIYNEENSRKRMMMLEGSFFVLVLFIGLWLVYRALIKQQELQRQQENFIMAVSHELKTPLASLSVYLDGLKSVDIPEIKKATIIPAMKSDVVRLRKLVDNILGAAKMKRADEKQQFMDFDLSQLTIDRIGILKKGIGSSGVSITTSIEKGIYFNGDKENLGRAIDSLLENSVIHNKGKQIELNVGLHKDNGEIVLTFADNGIGIEKDELEKIFDQFYRIGSEMTRTSQGTGLGLYLSRETIKAHGGSIVAQSEGPAKGVTFVIKLKEKEKFEKTSAG